MGFPRLPLPSQAELLPQLFNSIHNKPVQHQDSLVYIALPALAHVNLSTDALKQPYAFLKDKTDLTKYISEFFLDMLLLPYGLVLLFVSPFQTHFYLSAPKFILDWHILVQFLHLSGLELSLSILHQE